MGSIEKQSESTRKRERHPEIDQIETEQVAKLRKNLEINNHISRNREKDTVHARAEALLHASTSEIEKDSTKDNKHSPVERHGPITTKQLDAKFSHTMRYVYEDLSPLSRVFSKIIHNKIIERLSDGLSSTIARPNALLTGAVCAFVLTLCMYIFAKNMGYRLSGFEPIAAFLIGWLIGQLYDYFRVMITGKK